VCLLDGRDIGVVEELEEQDPPQAQIELARDDAAYVSLAQSEQKV